MAQTKASKQIRDFLVSLHKAYLPNIEAMRIAATTTGLSLSTVNQAVVQGKGSAVTHGLLLCYGFKIDPNHLESHLPKFRKVFYGAEKLSVLDEKIQFAFKTHSVDEIILWIELLLAKNKMETKLGIKKRAGRPKKSKSSNNS